MKVRKSYQSADSVIINVDSISIHIDKTTGQYSIAIISENLMSIEPLSGKAITLKTK